MGVKLLIITVTVLSASCCLPFNVALSPGHSAFRCCMTKGRGPGIRNQVMYAIHIKDGNGVIECRQSKGQPLSDFYLPQLVKYKAFKMYELLEVKSLQTLQRLIK